MSLEVHTD